MTAKQLEDMRAVLNLCRAMGVAAVEVAPDGSFKASLFPPMAEAVPIQRDPEPEEPLAAKAPDPDSTIMALQAQSGRMT